MVSSYIASLSVYFCLPGDEEWGGAKKKCEQVELSTLILSFCYCKFSFKVKKKLKLVLKQMYLPLSDITPSAVEISTTNRVSGILMVIQIVILNWYIRFPR